MKMNAICQVCEQQTDAPVHNLRLQFFCQYKLSSKGYQPIPLRPDLGELQWQLMKKERTSAKLRGHHP